MSEALLEEIIEKHNFIVHVNTDSDDPLCVMVDFAGRKQAYYRIVADEEGDIYGVAYWSSIMAPTINPETNEEVGVEEFIPMNRMIIRLYILCDIYRQCREMELSHEIVRFYSVEGDKIEFMDLLDTQLDDAEVEIEQMLEMFLHKVLNKNISIKELNVSLENSGLLHDFNLLRGTLV